MPVLLDLLLALPVAPLPLLLLQPFLLHPLLLEPQPGVQGLFPLLLLTQFFLFLVGGGVKDRAAHYLPAAHPAPQGLLAAPPSIPHLGLFPELLPVEPLHLHGGIGFLVSGALGRRRGGGGGGAGISEGE